jgi:hypothetical protein
VTVGLTDIIILIIACSRSLCINCPRVTERDAEQLHLFVSVDQLHGDCWNTLFEVVVICGQIAIQSAATGITKVLLPPVLFVTTV